MAAPTHHSFDARQHPPLRLFRLFYLAFLIEDAVHRVRRRLLHGRRDVPIQAQRDGDARMPKYLTDDLCIDTLCKQQRCRRVTQVMESHVWQLSSSEQCGKLPPSEMAVIHRSANRAGKNQIVLALPCRAECELLCRLERMMSTQCVHGDGWQGNTAPRVRSFGLGEHEACLCVLQCGPHLQRSAV